MTITTLKPLRSVGIQGLIAVIAFMTPVLVVLYVFTIPTGPWRVVLATQIIASIAVALTSWRFLAVEIRVSSGGISEQGFFRRRPFVPRQQIGSIVLAHTYKANSLDAAPQLFVLDVDGGLLVRIRGQLWPAETVPTVIRALDMTVETLADPVSTSELRDESRAVLYWFEQHPIWAALAFVGCTAVFGVLMLLVVRAAEGSV